ncbi:hypothetical protein BH09SUM1_BH09SUM1_09270 [soil metagenome]
MLNEFLNFLYHEWWWAVPLTVMKYGAAFALFKSRVILHWYRRKRGHPSPPLPPLTRAQHIRNGVIMAVVFAAISTVGVGSWYKGQLAFNTTTSESDDSADVVGKWHGKPFWNASLSSTDDSNLIIVTSSGLAGSPPLPHGQVIERAFDQDLHLVYENKKFYYLGEPVSAADYKLMKGKKLENPWWLHAPNTAKLPALRDVRQRRIAEGQAKEAPPAP